MLLLVLSAPGLRLPQPPPRPFIAETVHVRRITPPAMSGLRFAERIAAAAPCLRADEPLLPSQRELLERLDRELRETTEYLSLADHEQLRLALEVALLAHHGQTRRSGEPYITHPVAVACIVATTQLDNATVASAVLHDTVEDTALSLAEVESLFGPTVRKIVEGETKVSKLPNIVKDGAHVDDVQVENLRSMFIAMASDWRIVAVKLADRLHNMRTLQYMPIAKRASIARETLEIFAPLAHRLGMWQYKTELADLSFKYLFPTEYAQLDGHISSRLASYQETIDSVKAKLEELLRKDKWLTGTISHVAVTGRTKSIYSTWKKMNRHGCGVGRVHDLMALRVVLTRPPQSVDTPAADTADELALCYQVLGIIHGCWTPFPRTLKDYISAPKPNGYRSLHTTVLVGTQPLEVQIRTLEMHRVAEYGAAAHWTYKDESAASLPWMQIVQTWDAQVDSAHEFVRLVRQELLGTRVFVFTRNGRILNLARGATLADAAALLRASVRSHAVLINGSPAAPSYELQNGAGAGSIIVPLACTSREPPAHGLGVCITVGRPSQTSRPRLSAGDIVSLERREPLAIPTEWRPAYTRRDESDGGGSGALPRAGDAASSGGLQLCRHCQPIPGDPLAQALGLIHRADAECSLIPPPAAEPGAATPAAVSGDDARALLARARPAADSGEETEHEVSIVVFCTDRRGMLLDLSSIVTQEASNIVDVHSETIPPDSAFQYTVELKDVEQLRALMGRLLRDVDGVQRVVRGTVEGLMARDSPAAFWANCRPPDEDQKAG